MKLRKMNAIIIFLLFILFNTITTELTCKPDDFILNDDIWTKQDYADTENTRKGWVFKYVMGKKQYNDNRSGIPYEPVSTLCYENYIGFPKPEYPTRPYFNPIPVEIFQRGNFRIPITDSHLPYIWDNLCYPKLNFDHYKNQMHLPINFHADSKDSKYELKIRIANKSGSEQKFFFSLYRDYYQSELHWSGLYYQWNWNVQTQEIDDSKKTILAYSTMILILNIQVSSAGNVRIGTQNFVDVDANARYYNDQNTADWKTAYDLKIWAVPPPPSPPIISLPPPVLIPPITPMAPIIPLLDRRREPNLDFLFQGDQNIGIASVEMMKLKNSLNSDSYCGNNCRDTCPCPESYYCDKASPPKCQKCYGNCNTCDRSSAYNACLSCHPTSPRWTDLPNKGTQGKCDLDFLDITKFNGPIEIERVPPAIHWRFTIEFWTFVHYPRIIKDDIDLIYKDFLSVAMLAKNDTSLTMYCIPIEWLYPIDGEKRVPLKDHLDNELGAFYLKEDQDNVAAKWFHTKCGFNFDNNKSYMNNQIETNLKIPQMYQGQTNFPWQMKKFYKEKDFVQFFIKNHEKSFATNVYFRNINMYREYMPQELDTKYFNMHSRTTIQSFPQLLFSIPLDDITSTSNTAYEFQWYDYFDRTASKIVGNARLTKTVKITLTNSNGMALKPGRLFKRLNLLEINTQHDPITPANSNCEFINTSPITCNAPHQLCFDHSKPFLCNQDFYLAPTNQSCAKECPEGFMHHPIDSLYQGKNYCHASCGLNVQICPSYPKFYQDITNFACKNTFFDAYYKCYSEDEYYNKGNGLHFSSDLNTHTIVIPTTKLNSFVLEVWIYPDIRLSPTGVTIPKPKTDMIFMTNMFKIYTNLPGPRNQVCVKSSCNNVDDNYVNLNWNHFIFSSDYRVGLARTEYYTSFKHLQYYVQNSSVRHYRGAWELNGSTFLDTIYFCNRDKERFNFCEIDWINAYYRNIKIWDITHSSRNAIFNAMQFENGPNAMLIHHYTLNLQHMIKNTITDIVRGSNGYVPFVTEGQNPDNESFFNYESNFAYEEANIPLGQFIPSWEWDKKEISATGAQCDIGCILCNQQTRCLKCYPGYALFSDKCKLVVDYFFKNPSKNLPPMISLNIHASEMATKKYMTVFFFIKLYGFTNSLVPPDTIHKLIIFDNIDNFFIAYNTDLTLNGSIEIYHNNLLLFQFTNFNRDYMGHWIPISIAAFRQYDETFTLNMAQASIHYLNLPLLKDTPSIMPSLQFREFTIPNTWIGLLADIQIFDSFLVNAWGMIKFNTIDESIKYRRYHLPLHSPNPNQCLQNEDLLTTIPDLNVECYNDFNPHWSSCRPPGNYVHWDQNYPNPETACGSVCGAYSRPRCLGIDATDIPNNSWFEEQSCDNRNKDWTGYYLRFQGNKVVCPPLQWIDFARFKKAVLPKITGPPVVFSLDVWIYNRSHVGKNFKSITFTWDYHLKVGLKYDPGEGELIAYCYPVIDISHPERDPLPVEKKVGNNNWTYISCGVSINAKLMYLVNGNKITEETLFETVNTIPYGTVQFIIEEDSKNGYGMTQLRQLRLWRCYKCAVAFRNFREDGSFQFNDVIHSFPTSSTIGQLFDRKVPGWNYDIPEVGYYEGYNILPDPYEPLFCDENDWYYYRDGANNCDEMSNLARLNDFQFTISSSRNARYTIGFWFYIERSNEMSEGMNIIWEKHMSISLIRDSSQPETIVAVCFPQAYRDIVDGKGGSEIFDVYDKAVNKDKFDFTNSSSKWLYVQCAVDQTRKLMYINQNLEIPLTGETLYGMTTNYRPFRYFILTKQSILKFQGAKRNLTRIFFRSFRAYREYIDPRLFEIGLVDHRNSINSFFWPIVIYIDFVEYDRWCNTDNSCGLIYYLYDEQGSNGLQYHRTFRNNPILVTYATYPTYYVLQICKNGQNGGDNIACSGPGSNFRLLNSSTRLFYPFSDNAYLNLDTLTQSSTCPLEYTRLPDTGPRNTPNKGYCLLPCAQPVEQCPKSLNNNSNYKNNYSCIDGYSRVYYECINNLKVKNSAMYFSNYFSFNNILINMKSIGFPITNIKSYYLEFWLKLDMINFGNKITQRLHYFFAPPHEITQDPVDQLFKYSNNKMTGKTYYPLSAFSSFEWNRIIIENYYDATKNSYTIYLYLNYDFINPVVTMKNLDATLNDMSLQGIAFCNQPIANCIINSSTYNLSWGTAWYRNIRVWDERIATLELIQSCEVGYTQLLTSQVFYFQFTIDFIVHNTIKNRINNSVMSSGYWYDGNTYDDDTRQNYSIEDFDMSYLNPGYYVNGMNLEGNDYTILPCAAQCKRCYSSASTKCYECQPGYSLYGTECKAVSGYYFKTPTQSTTVPGNEVEIKIAFPIKDENPITITVWIKFFGIELNTPIPPLNSYPIMTFKKSNPKSYLGFNPSDQTFIIIIENNEAFKIPSKKYIGKWTHFGISVHRSEAPSYPDLITTFPHMVNFMMDQTVFTPVAGFNPETTKVTLDCISLNTKVIAYYSGMKFYSNYWFATYGHINALSSTRGIDLKFEVKLFGTAHDNCISDSELVDLANTIKPICIADYNPYDDNLNVCSSDFYYLDLTISKTPPCALCNTKCVTQCYKGDINSCTCNYREDLYWIATQEPVINSYYCQKVDSVNFSFFNPITLTNLDMVKNDEMTLEFWVYVYSYFDGKFTSLDLLWDKHLRVTIEANGFPNGLKANCYPYVDSKNPGGYTTHLSDLTMNMRQWHYVRCAADRFHKVYYLNNKLIPEAIITPDPPIATQLQSSLTIVDKMNTANWNYGFAFVREIKLFSSYNYDFWQADQHNFTPKNFKYLLHYFKGKFDKDDIKKSEIFDVVTEFAYPLTLRPSITGYSYVKAFEYLNQCNEDDVWETTSLSCEVYNVDECKIARRKSPTPPEYKCLLCSNSIPYMKDDDKCYADCSPYYYADDYLKQCRKCDSSCLTCSGKKDNECLSCEGILNLVPNLHICIENCEAYGLTASVTDPLNTCVPFNASAIIINHDITKPIDLAIFTNIEAKVIQNTADIAYVEWRFEESETINENAGHRNLADLVFPYPVFVPAPPPIRGMNVAVHNNFFMLGYKYVFYLDIFSKDSTPITQTFVSVKFVVIINDYPLVGKLNVLPAIGYLSHTFLFTCNKCTDDFTKKEQLQYEFSYMTNKNDPTTEIIVQPYSTNSEVLHKFTTINTNNEYYIKCYCRDEYSIVNSTIYTLKVYESPNDSGEDIPLDDMIGNIDLDELLSPEQLNNRAEFLYSITVNFPNRFILSRTTVTSPNDNLTLTDPIGTEKDEYCNKRGDSYIIDKFLYCDCKNYKGKNCQIDANSYNLLLQVYIQLYTKIKEAQTRDYNHFLLNGIHLQLKSAAFFFNQENMAFMLQGIEYVNMYMQNFPSDMLSNGNHIKFIEIYDALVEYGLIQVNTFKMEYFIEINSKLPNGLYNEVLVRNCTMKDHQIALMSKYFKNIKTNLGALMKFFISNRFIVSHRLTNINIYVAFLNENFVFDTFFANEKAAYEPYFDVTACLSNVMKTNYAVATYKILMSSVIWKTSPFISEDKLYLNNTTPLMEIDFYDYNTMKQIFLTNCGLNSDVELYFPVDSFTMPPRINDKRPYVSPENQYDMTHDIFNDPVFIDPIGEVFNSTPQERIDNFFVPFNFSCTYYDDPTNSLLTKGCDYTLYTDLNYIQCKCIHLTDFVTEKYEVIGEFKVNSRFFYLKHYMLLAFLGNYPLNPMLFFFVALIALYIIVIIVYSICDCYIIRRKTLMNYLKSSIVRINLPYRDSYDFSDDIHLDDEIRMRLEGGGKRKPDPLEHNVGINNIDVMILADNITKFDKEFKDNRNDMQDKGNFFNPAVHQQDTLPDKHGKFFRNKEQQYIDSDKHLIDDFDTKAGINDDNDNPRKKGERLRKFFDNDKRGTQYTTKTFEDEDKINLKRNKDVGAPKKIYGHNPLNDDNDEDNQQKHNLKAQAKPRSNFFDQEDTRIKEVNPYQEQYTHYNPTFSQPKVISKKLDFFDKDNTMGKSIEVTQDEFGRKKNANYVDPSKKNKDADVKVQYSENKSDGDRLNEAKEDLPKLAVILTNERRLLEYNRLDLTAKKFFSRNISNRYILSATFAKFSICYGRFKRIGNFIAQMALYSLFLSILFTADAKINLYQENKGYSIGMFILYCIVAEIGGCLLIHLPSYFFYIDVKHFRVVYDTLRETRGLEVMKDWEKVTSGKFWWNLLGITTQWVYIAISFYFSFGFCATYVYQAASFLLAVCCTILLDWFIIEFLWEGFIALLYKLKGNGRRTILLAEFLNRTRNMKTLT